MHVYAAVACRLFIWRIFVPKIPKSASETMLALLFATPALRFTPRACARGGHARQPRERDFSSLSNQRNKRAARGDDGPPSLTALQAAPVMQMTDAWWVNDLPPPFLFRHGTELKEKNIPSWPNTRENEQDLLAASQTC